MSQLPPSDPLHSQPKDKGTLHHGRPRTEGKPPPPSGSGSALAHRSDTPAVEAPAPIRFLRFGCSEIVLCLEHFWWVFFLLKDPDTKIGRLAPACGAPPAQPLCRLPTGTCWILLITLCPSRPPVSVTSPPPTTLVLLKCLCERGSPEHRSTSA